MHNKELKSTVKIKEISAFPELESPIREKRASHQNYMEIYKDHVYP